MSPEICSNNPYGTKTDMWSFGTILFALLSGSLPFTADNYHALFHRINEGTFEYPPGLEDLLSENVKTLNRSLFTVDPTSRWSAQQALKSDWFRPTMDGSLNNIDLTRNLKILIRFNAKRRLRAAVLSLIATEKLRRYPANGRLRAAVLTVIATRRFQERYPVGGNGI
jgi:serine/threonine protein kinase